MTKQNASDPYVSPNSPLTPVVTPGSQQETWLRQIFVISISLGIVELVFSGLMLVLWTSAPAMLDAAMNTEGMPAEQIAEVAKVREELNKLPPTLYHGVTIGFVLFGILPGLIYVSLARSARRFKTSAILILLILAVMQSFVFGMFLIQSLSQLSVSPCGMMFYTIIFGTLVLTTGSLAWKLFQLRQFQMRHLLALQQGVNAQYRQAQANQVSKMAQDHHENTKHELKRPVEPWDES